MLWLIGAVCCALATAVELSESTFNAAARFTGAATLAFTNDMAARSGRASPASSSSSSLLSLRYSEFFAIAKPPGGVGWWLQRRDFCSRSVSADLRNVPGVCASTNGPFLHLANILLFQVGESCGRSAAGQSP